MVHCWRRTTLWPWLLIISSISCLTLVGSQLSSKARDVSDGTCNFVDLELAEEANVVELYYPWKRYYIPRASEAFYRAIYEILNGHPADTREDLTALVPRAQFLTLKALKRTGDLEVSFHGGRTDWYAYRCLPSTFRTARLSRPLVPMLNVTCTFVGGRPGTATRAQVGPVYFAVIWSDETAVNVWGCMGGEQNWHIISTTPELTPEQVRVNDELLRQRGFNTANAMDIKYIGENT